MGVHPERQRPDNQLEFNEGDFLRIDDPKDTIRPDIGNDDDAGQISARRNSDNNV